nr:hypothetical protein [Tanacetum cinerariifolium]
SSEGSGVILEVPDRLSPKGQNEGSSVTPTVPDEPIDSSSSSGFNSEDEIEDISSDEVDEAEKADESKKFNDKKEADEQVKEEHAKKPEEINISSSLTLSSAEYTNQFLNDNPIVLVNEVLKEPVEAINLWSSKYDKTVDADDTVQDDAMDVKQLKEDVFVDAQDDAAPTQERSNKPLTLHGALGRLTIPVDFFFNKDLEYITTGNVENKYATTLTKPKAVSIVIKKKVEDVQLGMESYQTKLNITMPQVRCDGLDSKEPYTIFYEPRGVFYLNKDRKKYLMRADEVYKFGDGTHKKVLDKLDYMLHNFDLGYNEGMPKRSWTNKDKKRMTSMLEKIEKTLLERRIMRSL